MVASVPQLQDAYGGQIGSEALLKLKQEYAERCFSNAQELSRLMDMKASYLLSAVGLLTAALGIVAAKALDVAPATIYALILKSAGTLFFLAYVIVAFLVVYNATRIFQALPNTIRRDDTVPGLIFPLVILSRLKATEEVDEQIYYHKLLEVGPADILRDYAHEIVEISLIYERKQQQINLAAGQFRWLTIFWIVTLLLYVVTVILR